MTVEDGLVGGLAIIRAIGEHRGNQTVDLIDPSGVPVKRAPGGDGTIDVAAGSVFFVPAREQHRFHDITEDLAVLVFFGPAEGTR